MGRDRINHDPAQAEIASLSGRPAALVEPKRLQKPIQIQCPHKIRPCRANLGRELFHAHRSNDFGMFAKHPRRLRPPPLPDAVQPTNHGEEPLQRLRFVLEDFIDDGIGPEQPL